MALVPSGYRELLLCVPSWDFSTWGVLARKISNVKKTVEHGLLKKNHRPRLDVFLTISILGRSSIERRKTETKVITLTNHKGHRQAKKPIKTRSKYVLPTRENVFEWITIGFSDSSDWMKKWREIFKPIV